MSAKLGNTPSICRKCYVHPAIVEGYLDGSLLHQMRRRPAEPTDPNGLDADERGVLQVLRAAAKKVPQAA